MPITKHAAQRCEERGIRQEAVSLIMGLGRYQRTRDNAVRCRVTKTYLRKATTRRLSSRERQLLDKVYGLVLILDPGRETIITAYRVR